MQNLTFSVHINASRPKVWRTLWEDATYRQWTSLFTEGSHAVSDWKEGSQILFYDGKGSGMYSRIARMTALELMSFQHLGILMNGEEVPDTGTSDNWKDSFETYKLTSLENGTLLEVELSSAGGEEYETYFKEVFPKALARLKELAERQPIIPFLWFDNNAEEAIQLYTDVFPNSGISSVSRKGDTFFSGTITLAGQPFMVLNGGPMFSINPSISFYAVCETEAEVTETWTKLVEGGKVMMPFDTYPWSPKYGWLQDRFGVSWQITMGKVADMGQKITPALMFTGAQHGRAGEAITRYSGIFRNSRTVLLSHYPPGGADPETTLNHAQFRLDGSGFIVMDSAHNHGFQFNEAVSFLLPLDTQEEVDYFWDKLTADGGTEGRCGWLKDTFGVSWQVVPVVLSAGLLDPDPNVSQRTFQAMIGMQKIIISEL